MVAAVAGGMTQIEAARVFGVSRRVVGVWVRAHATSGEAAFRPSPRGRPPGDQFALPLPEQAKVLEVLASGPPEAAGIDSPLWTRRSVSTLVDREFGLRLSPTTVGHYLVRWGLAADPALARAPGGPHPLGGAPMGLGGWVGRPRARETMWTAWSRPAPDSPGGILEVLIATSTRGASAFLLGRSPYDAAGAGDFADRLVRHLGRGVHLIVCGWPPEHADVLRAWAGATPPDGPVRVST